MPSRCATVVTAKIQEPITEGSSVLFEPDKKWTGEAEVQIEDSVAVFTVYSSWLTNT